MNRKPKKKSLVTIGFLAGMNLFGACQTTESTSKSRITSQTTAPPMRPVTVAEIPSLMQASPAKATLLNVWATWCAPCQEEFPFLLKLSRKYRGKGLNIILISADFASELDAAQLFLNQQGVDFPTYYKTDPDMTFINGIHPQWSGSLPATVLFDQSGKATKFKQGVITYKMLEKWVQEALRSNER